VQSGAEISYPLYKATRKKPRIKATLWAQMQSFLLSVDLPDWETLFRLIAKSGAKLVILTAPDTGWHYQSARNKNP